MDNNNPIFLPDYDNSILSVSASLATYYQIPTNYKTNPLIDSALQKGYKNVILFVVDGLGKSILFNHMPETAFLRQKYRKTISSVFPPTTAAATRTLQTALPPIVHGWLGWNCYFKEYQRAITLFTDTDYYTDLPVPDFPGSRKLIPFTFFWQKINPALNIQTHILFPDKIDHKGIVNLHKMNRRIKEITQSDGKHFIYAYWAEPDHTSHAYGPDSPEVANRVRLINRRLRQLHADLKDTLLIITADHGQISASETLLINQYPELLDCLACPLSLEGRAVSVFVKPDKKDVFEREFAKHLAQDFILVPREEVIKNALFGKGTPHPKAHDFIGDYLLIAITDKILEQTYPEDKRNLILRGSHAGITKKEMEVPLIIAPSKDKS